MHEAFIEEGGPRLAVRSWRPSGSARAIVGIVPGFNSHGGYYVWVGEQLAAHGFSTWAVDLRGRGKSEGERYYIDSINDYVSDVDRMLSLARSREQGLPVYLLGHSAGGVVSCVYTLEHQAELAGLVCMSFAFQVPAPDVALALLKGVSHLAPHAHVLRLKLEDFSRDPAAVQAMRDDPAVNDEVQPSLTVAELARADERLKREFPLVTLPVLIMHGTADKATKPEGSQFFFDTAGSADKTLTLYEGHYHDMLNDVGREKVLGDVLAWIEERVG